MRTRALCAGEPELSVAPHVLHHPVHVYQGAQGRSTAHLQLLTKYGEEYKPPAICVLFTGAHYDLLTAEAPRSKL